MKLPKVIAAALALCASASSFAATTSDADQVFDRYIAAMGGVEHLGQVKTRSYEGKISSGFLSSHYQSRFERPNHFQEEFSFLGMGSTTGYDGSKGWIKKGGDVTVVTGDTLFRAIRGHSLDWYSQYKSWYTTRRLLPDSNISGTPVHVIETVAANGDREVWSFDAKTGLLLQLDGMTHEEGKPPQPARTTFSDYQSLDGVMLARKISMQAGKKTFSMTIENVKQNMAIDPIRFPAGSGN